MGNLQVVLHSGEYGLAQGLVNDYCLCCSYLALQTNNYRNNYFPQQRLPPSGCYPNSSDVIAQ